MRKNTFPPLSPALGMFPETITHPYTRTSRSCEKCGLVLQLRFMSAVVGLSCAELMALSPSGPRQDERRAQERSQQQFGNETSNFGHAGQADADGGYAASTGLVLFGLPNVARRSEACNLARNAAAAIHNVIWRCQPCQDRASQ